MVVQVVEVFKCSPYHEFFFEYFSQVDSLYFTLTLAFSSIFSTVLFQGWLAASCKTLGNRRVVCRVPTAPAALVQVPQR